MVYQKDNLPLIFFLPMMVFLALMTRRWWGYLFATAGFVWLWDSIKHATPLYGGRFFSFPSLEEHGQIGERTTARMMDVANGLSVALIVVAVVCVCISVVMMLFVRRKDKHGTEEPAMD